ncbi:chromatin structure-remodeling complex subunit RSC9 [Cryptococcus deuterogattii LA55]|nr:chromatin structure-remodeling complex subunit RSC9 [Cryptococcus deuterogattii LA55]KIR89752.1 chromatin structure-remodeling complex subunit RSC9 [Cryptococcus deuterogattii CBS 10090]
MQHHPTAAAQPSRTIAPMPHHRVQQPRITPYTPNVRDLNPGPKNRLILALRSNIPFEVDWALPQLVVASFDQSDGFKLEAWPDSVCALQEWPAKWLEGLEREAAVFDMKAGRLDFEGDETNEEERMTKRRKRDLALGAMVEWENDPKVEQRATNSLLVLRNASFYAPNAKILSNSSFLAFLADFFSLPPPFLQHLCLKTPEPIHHILIIVQSIFPHLRVDMPGIDRIKHIFGVVFPQLFVDTRDIAMMNNLIPLMMMGQTIPNNQPPPPELIPHLLQLLVLRPPGPLLDLTLDILISLSTNPIHSRAMLSHPSFPYHLKSIIALLEHQARPVVNALDPPISTRGKMVRNPAGQSCRAEELYQRRTKEREAALGHMDPMAGGRPVYNEVGDKPPTFSAATKKRLFRMKEPERSIEWMHQSFVYSSTAQVLQVTFWHAYRDFFTNPACVEPMLSASDVIKNVTAAFPGASAKVWTDATGAQKFVIAGVGFRKRSDDDERFTCYWDACPQRHSATNPVQLLEHIRNYHLQPFSAPRCQWGSCDHCLCTYSHLLTHIPLGQPPSSISIPDAISCHIADHSSSVLQRKITNRTVPPLSNVRLAVQGAFTPVDARRQPTGAAFLAALLIRNLARTLRAEISLALPDSSHAQSQEAADEAQARKRHLLEERYGLPIPDSVLKEEEEEQANMQQGQELDMSEEERERAKRSFENVEERIIKVMLENVSGITQYLGDALGL